MSRWREGGGGRLGSRPPPGRRRCRRRSRHERRVDAEQGGESADEHVAERDHPGGAAIAAGHAPVDAFLSGYRWGLLLAAGLVVAGGAAAFAALRRANHDDEREPTREDLVLAG